MRKTRTLSENITRSAERHPTHDEAQHQRAPPHLCAWVERVTDPVAEHVEREHRERDRKAGRERNRRAGADQLVSVLDDRPPARVRRLNADRQERERRLGEHRDRHDEGEEDDHRRGDVREDVLAEQPRPRRAEADRRLDELAPAQRQHLAAHRPRDVRDVDDADDRDRERDAPRPDPHRAEHEILVDQDHREADGEEVDGERPDDLEDARDHAVGDAAEEAGDDADQRAGETRDQSRRRNRSAASCARRTGAAPRRRVPGCPRRGSSGADPRSGRSACVPMPSPPVDGAMTGTLLPCTIVVPLRCDVKGSVCATSCA